MSNKPKMRDLKYRNAFQPQKHTTWYRPGDKGTPEENAKLQVLKPSKHSKS